MSYFTPEFNEYFKGLAANNHKEYFADNKKTYEEFVKRPFYKLVEDLILDVQNIHPLEANIKNSVYRVNNDIRFHKHKPIYKTYVGASIKNGGRKTIGVPSLFFHLSPGECYIGGGFYSLTKEQLYKMRLGIAHNLDTFKLIYNGKAFQKYYKKFGETEVHKIIDKELRNSAKIQPLIFNKQFYFIDEINNGESFILQNNLKELILDHYISALPMSNFLQSFV